MSKKEQENGWEKALGRSGINLEEVEVQFNSENFDIDQELSIFLYEVSLKSGTEIEIFEHIRSKSLAFLLKISDPKVILGGHLKKYPNMLLAFKTFGENIYKILKDLETKLSTEEMPNISNSLVSYALQQIELGLSDCTEKMLEVPELTPFQKLTNLQDELTDFIGKNINSKIEQKLHQLAPKAFKINSNNPSLNDLKDEIKNIPGLLAERTALVTETIEMRKHISNCKPFIAQQKDHTIAAELADKLLTPMNIWKSSAQKRIDIISKNIAIAANKHLGEPDIVEEVVTESAKTEDKKLSISNLDKIQSELSNLEKEYSEKIVNLLSKLYPKAFNESKGKPSLTHLKDEVCKIEGFKNELDSFTAEINSQITTQLKNLKSRSEFVKKNPNIQATTKIIDLLEKNYTTWKAALEDKFNKTMDSLKEKLEIYFSEDNNNQHQQNLPEGKETVKEESKQEVSNTTPALEDKAKIENDVLITGTTEEVLEHYPES